MMRVLKGCDCSSKLLPLVACGVGSNFIDPIEGLMVVDCVGTWC